MKCHNHHEKEAVAVYEKVGFCRKCLVDFIIEADRKIRFKHGVIKAIHKKKPKKKPKKKLKKKPKKRSKKK